MAKKKDEKLEAVETEETMAKFQEKLQEKLDLKNKLIDLFFMSLYLTTFVFINICIFYR